MRCNAVEEKHPPERKRNQDKERQESEQWLENCE
jgi:hypothetical protein